MKLLDFKNNKIVLGTAQFESNYGITTKNKLQTIEMKKVLQTCYLNNINMMDTAIDYDRVEKKLGNLNVKKFNIISKASFVKNHNIIKDIDLEKILINSIENLKVKNLYAFLVRKPHSLIYNNSLWKVLLKFKQKGLINKIGFSLYTPDELKKVYNIFKPDIIQIPISIVDNRFENKGWLDLLARDKVEIHARSVFLQGLLLEDSKRMPNGFQKYSFFFAKIEKWLEDNKVSNLEACLSKLYLDERITRIVVGINNKVQLDAILQTHIKNIFYPNWLIRAEEKLINPSLWSIL